MKKNLKSTNAREGKRGNLSYVSRYRQKNELSTRWELKVVDENGGGWKKEEICERREKIKNVILYLSERIHLNIQELPYVLVLVNFLLCMMDPNKATSIVIKLSDIMLTFPHLLTWKTLML